MRLRITKQGEDVLKRKARPVVYDQVRDDLPTLLKNMWETMYGVKGVGLAAPQIDMSLRLAIIDIKPDGNSDPLVLINPVIVKREGEIVEEEGCLSLPGLYARVRRHRKVTVRALDEHGAPWERTGTGLLARAFEHEVDHLDGKLFINHLPLTERLRIAPILKDIKKNWD
ncbi:MAG: peptide deformylase [Elusimicrobiota bacterium]